MSSNLSEKESRGLDNPKVVDLIQKHSDNTRAELVLLLHPVWDDEKEVVKALEEKFNNYLDYILDGHFWAQYPKYQNLRAVITLEHSIEPLGQMAELIEAMKSFCFSVGIDLETRAAA